MPQTNKVRTVQSALKGLKIKEFLKQYRLHLGGSGRRFGSIDSTMQFTLKLINAVVLECECLTLAQHIFSTFPTREQKHAEVIMKGKNDLCKEYSIIFHVLKWLYIIIVSIMICKTLTNTTFYDNQFNFNNCFIIELELLAIKK